MSKVDLLMPKMGESIIEATILKWRKKPGETVELDEAVLDIATDKVDSEVCATVAGVLVEVLFPENAVVPINTVIARIETAASNGVPAASPAVSPPASASAPTEKTEKPAPAKVPFVPENQAVAAPSPTNQITNSPRFYSPLVRTMAKTEGIGQAELDRIPGTGQGGRVSKTDMVAYLEKRSTASSFDGPYPYKSPEQKAPAALPAEASAKAGSLSGAVEIIEMDRMRKLIADHMVMSKHTSPHVTSFIEADVTDLVNWRTKHKDEFKRKYGDNLTFTPLFLEAVARALRDFPMVNSSVDGTKILVKRDINIGMAAALPSGNLIVPVIKGADLLSLPGLAKSVNDLANRARQNQLKPDEIQGGTFTVTNVGTFGNLMGTPIINQPQAAILATGAIVKKPAVLETEHGDVIAVRHMMFLSLSYDHRIVDGALGGAFLRRIGDYLEGFDRKRGI